MDHYNRCDLLSSSCVGDLTRLILKRTYSGHSEGVSHGTL
jgi:hypothetical protein